MVNEAEYCLLWIDWWGTCMTKSEWASWSQLFGVVASLLIALYFPISSERMRRKEEHKKYLNERYALASFKDDVIQFVGYLSNNAKVQQDLVIDEVQYGRILERLAYYDLHLRDSSSKKLLLLIRRTLSNVYAYKQASAEGRMSSGRTLHVSFMNLYHSQFKPEDVEFFHGAGE